MLTLMKDGLLLDGCKMRSACCRMVVVFQEEGLALWVADMMLVACRWDAPLLESQVQASQWELAWAFELEEVQEGLEEGVKVEQVQDLLAPPVRL